MILVSFCSLVRARWRYEQIIQYLLSKRVLFGTVMLWRVWRRVRGGVHPTDVFTGWCPHIEGVVVDFSPHNVGMLQVSSPTLVLDPWVWFRPRSLDWKLLSTKCCFLTLLSHQCCIFRSVSLQIIAASSSWCSHTAAAFLDWCFFKFRSSQGKFVFSLIWKSVPTLCCLHTFLSPQSRISWSFVVLYFSSMYSCVFKVMSPHCSRSASLSVFRLFSSRCRKVRTDFCPWFKIGPHKVLFS